MDDHPQRIFHLTPSGYYHRQAQSEPYRPDTFRQDGFIHCTSSRELLVEIANTFFAGLSDGLLVLEIDPALLTAPLKFEPPMPPADTASTKNQLSTSAPAMLFPHVYGPLNREAIVRRFALRRDETGRWKYRVKKTGE